MKFLNQCKIVLKKTFLKSFDKTLQSLLDNSLKNDVLTADAPITNTPMAHSGVSASHISASHDQSPSNKIIQTKMFTDTISNEVKLSKLKDASINELHGKLKGILKDQIKLQHTH